MGKTTCAFFRPGKDEVIFASTHLDPKAREKQKAELDFRASGKERRYSWDYDEAMDIFAARRDGSNLRQLTKTNGYDAEGSYSPDGSKIVFCSLRGAYPLEKLSAEDRKRYETDPGLLRRDLPHGRGRFEPAPAHFRARLRWRAILLAGWAAHHLAAVR